MAATFTALHAADQWNHRVCKAASVVRRRGQGKPDRQGEKDNDGDIGNRCAHLLTKPQALVFVQEAASVGGLFHSNPSNLKEATPAGEAEAVGGSGCVVGRIDTPDNPGAQTGFHGMV